MCTVWGETETVQKENAICCLMNYIKLLTGAYQFFFFRLECSFPLSPEVINLSHMSDHISFIQGGYRVSYGPQFYNTLVLGEPWQVNLTVSARQERMSPRRMEGGKEKEPKNTDLCFQPHLSGWEGTSRAQPLLSNVAKEEQSQVISLCHTYQDVGLESVIQNRDTIFINITRSFLIQSNIHSP